MRRSTAAVSAVCVCCRCKTLLLEVDSAALGEALKWEPARGGELFPHLYGPLPVSAVAAEFDLPLGEDGLHVFPAMKAE